MPRLLTADQLAIVREAWAAGRRRDEVCQLAGITLHVFEARRRDQLRDLPPRTRGVGGGHRSRPPSPVEIRLATFEVRERWTPERWMGQLPDGDVPLGLPAAPAADRGPP